MTIDEFFEELAKLDLHFSAVGHFNMIRCEKGDCPIIALNKKINLNTRRNDNFDWPSAAKELGLPFNEAEEIMRAADSYYPSDNRLRLEAILKIRTERHEPNQPNSL